MGALSVIVNKHGKTRLCVCLFFSVDSVKMCDVDFNYVLSALVIESSLVYAAQQ